MEPESLLDTTNCCVVGSTGDGVAIFAPPQRGEIISKAKALNLAAWLVAVANDADDSFGKLLKRVEST